jgi:anti-sigma B factor antagonist
MQVTTTDKGSYTVISVSGRLDASTSPDFDSAVRALGTPPAKNVLVNLAGLEFVSSSGLRSFLSLAKAAQKAGLRTAFCSLGPVAADIFKIAGFNSILKILPDEASAETEL